MCWCAAGFTCSNAEDFAVDFGEFTVIGPSPLASQGRTCVSGRPCQFGSFLGHGLSLGDRMTVFDTCALRGGPSLAHAGRLCESCYPDLVVDATGQLSLSFGGVSSWRIGGGQYRICWCANSFGCSSMERFVVDVGELSIIGPHSLTAQGRTCVVGMPCDIDAIEGYFISAADGYFVMDTCGSGRVVEHLTSQPLSRVRLGNSSNQSSTSLISLSQLSVSSFGGSYRLCWCGSVDSSAPCIVPTEYVVDVGELFLVGPSLRIYVS
jgi:hypothetical protein